MQGGPEPALWMLWMTLPGRPLLNQGGDLPQAAGGEAGPMHPREVAAAMTSTTKTKATPGTFRTPGIPTMMTSGLGSNLTLTLGPATSAPGTLGMMAPDPGTPPMTGGY